jgi:hypothetical protein
MDEETNEDSKYSSSRRKSALARRRPASFPSRKSGAWLAAESLAENTKNKNVAEDRDFIKFPAVHEFHQSRDECTWVSSSSESKARHWNQHLVQSRAR